MMASENETATLNHSVVLRLLNSDLSGCEFNLTSGVTLFIVADAENIRQQNLEKVEQDNTIFVPMENGGVNFELVMENPSAELPGVMLRELNELNSSSLMLKMNQVICVGALRLAIRNKDDIWHDEVLNYSPEVKDVFVNKVYSNKPWSLIASGLVVFMLISGCFALFCDYSSSTKKQELEIYSLLDGRQEKYSLVHGDDQITYVFSRNKLDKNWAQQALVHTPPPSPVKVLDVLTEEARLSHWLQENWPKIKFQRVKMTLPQQPKLMLSEERGELTIQVQQEMVAALKKAFPYVEYINTGTVSDRLVVDQAEQGLKKIAVPYSKTSHQDSVTFVIQGAIDDNELERVKSFVHHFEQSWGDHYIQFSIGLNKDWLKGKSFKYGEQGYVKVSPYHWYFPEFLSIDE